VLVLHALLHGKLDPAVPEPERREDALTSAVFGMLVVVEAWDLISKWLKVRDWRPAPEGELDCWFWPRLAGGVEPDVIVRLGRVLIVVEAKYRSGRHDLSLDDEEEERPVDQIVRQHRAVSPPHDSRSPYPELLERAVRECRLLQAFVVDARRIRRARREHSESLSRLPKDAAVNLVTWQELYGLLLSPQWVRPRWAIDLRAYLRACGLASFQGIRRNMAGSSHLQAISRWTPFVVQRAAPAFRTAASGLAFESAIGELWRWRSSPTRARKRTRP
jgi:hypothetical protein